MTQVELRSAPSQPAGRAPQARAGTGWRSGLAALAPLALVALALGLRWFRIESSYDIFIDEVTYRELAQSVADGRGLDLYGDPFTLHPPVTFLLLGGVLRVFGLDLDAVDGILALRHVAAVAGALVVLGVWLLARRVGLGRTPSLVAAGLVAVDPFQISFDSRVLMEPFAQLFLIGCLLLLAMALQAPKTSRHRWWLVAGAAVCGGLTMSTKETFGLVLVGTLMVLTVWFRVVASRQSTLVVLLGSIGGYAVCSTVMSLLYGFSTWLDTRTNGLSRLLGTHQPTGFNSPTSQVSLTSRMIANAQDFGVTYGVLLLGGVATMLLMRRLRRLQHLRRTKGPSELLPSAAAVILPAWSLVACGYLVYATLLGSLEEQMYYITLAPCVLTLVLWARQWRGTLGRDRASMVVTALVVVGVFFNLHVWQSTHSTDVNAYADFMTWEPTHVPDDSRIAVTEGTAQFLITNTDLGEWSTMDEFRRERVDYVLVQTKLVREGYGVGREPMLDELVDQATLVFRARAGEGDELLLFDVRQLTGGSR